MYFWIWKKYFKNNNKNQNNNNVNNAGNLNNNRYEKDCQSNINYCNQENSQTFEQILNSNAKIKVDDYISIIIWII